MRKKLTPLSKPTALNHALIVLLDQADPAGQARVVIRRKVRPARRVTRLAELTFCFSFKRFATFCKEM